MTTHSKYAAPADFNVETEMKDVEILRISPDRVLAKGKRYGRHWLLRGLPPEKRLDPEAIRQLREEFDRRFSRREPDAPLTVGMEDIPGLGQCIVEEWREDHYGTEVDEGNCPKPNRNLRRWCVIVAALILMAAAIGVGLHIRSLTMRSESVKADLEKLRVAHRQEETRMLMLADSLDRVMNAQLIPEEFGSVVKIEEEDKEDKEERMANALYEARIQEFKEELVRYDQEVIPQVIEDRPVFLDSICALYRQMKSRAADVDPYGIFPELPEDDRIRVTANLYGGYISCLLEYSRVWMPKAWAAYQKKMQEKDAGNKD